MKDTHDNTLEQKLDELGLTDLGALGLDDDLVSELSKLEGEERQRLGLTDAETKPDQWVDAMPSTFTKQQREHTTVLVSGLTMAHDQLIQAALSGVGYKVKALDCPDNDALRFGKEFGNRGQCNPTYFTVGNLVKFLTHLRDEEGLTHQQIVDSYVFVTAGACGPCRFGTYVTEYRKALRDAGFDGFRVLLFQQTGGLKQATGDDQGLEMNPTFFVAIVKSLLIGDVLNALGYRIRPYEVEAGATNRAIDECKDRIRAALSENKLIVPVLLWCRQRLAQVEVDRSRVKPRVAIIGEFWAMTTEGDGNYKLQSFLEQEGAEVEVQLVTAWLLYMIWEGRHDTQRRASLRGTDLGRKGLEGVDVRKKLALLWAAERAVRSLFGFTSALLGLNDYHLPDMDEIASVSHEFYDNMLRGGEGHMEVGKLIMNTVHNKVNMTVSVKPFGCMPSSGVSDGVQSLITEMYPQAIFLPIETTGDGAVNVYSRIQMQLFKARKAAKKELDDALESHELDAVAYTAAARASRYKNALHRSPHYAGCTAADLAHEIGRRKHPIKTAVAKLKDVASKLRPKSDRSAISRAAQPR
jgi:predicted nucleotide-binding protein (sugar kinase/HSP70/actin superfamily)